MITIAEISECFPNKFRPVTGEFIYQHAKALSELCRVITVVPLRYVPSKEIFSKGPLKAIKELNDWNNSLSNTVNFNEGNLSVLYFGYVSLPRPYFESADIKLINFFFYNKIKILLKDLNPDLICCHWLRPWADLSAKLAKELNVPFVIDHHEDIPTLKKLFPVKHEKFLKSFEKADRIIVHSTINKKELEAENLSLKEISVVYLGQNFTAEEKTKVFNFSNPKLICASHLYERRKNIDILIKAVSILNKRESDNISLTVVGDGTLRKEYEELADSLGVSGIVEFAGSRSQEELGKMLEDSDIFILPSYPEAFGIVLTEALAKGLPVITCTGNGGGEELKNLGYPAVLVKPESPEILAGAVSGMLKDRERMILMSEKGKQIVKDFFNWNKNAFMTKDVFEETIKQFHSNE